MGTWRNDGTRSYRTMDISGEAKTVPPKGLIASGRDLSYLSGMTKISDLPYPQTSMFDELITFTGAETIVRNFSGEARNGEVYARGGTKSGEISVYFENTSNTPRAALLRSGRSHSFERGDLDGVSRLLFVSTGDQDMDFHVERWREGDE